MCVRVCVCVCRLVSLRPMPADGGTGDGGPPGLRLKNEASEADLCRLSPNKQAPDPGPRPEGGPATQTAISPSPLEPSREANGHTPSDRKTERAKPAGHMCLVVRGTQTTDCPTQKCCSCPAFLMAELMERSAWRGVKKSQLKSKMPFWWIYWLVRVRGIFLSSNVHCILSV